MNDNYSFIKISQKEQHISVKGAGGLRGLPGPKGNDGSQGPSGAIRVGMTTTLPAGSDASVENVGTASSAVFRFAIPRGDKGEKGDAGAGLEITGSVDSYSELPNNLTPSDAGKAYFNQADGKLYVWSGTQFPADGEGSQFKGDTGATGPAGANGFSPVVIVERISNGAIIKAVDADGATEATVYDGATPTVPTKTSELTNDSGYVSGSGTVGGSMQPVYADDGVLKACDIWASGSNWGTIATISDEDGIMSIGKNLDFYNTESGGRTARIFNPSQNVIRVATSNINPGDLQIGSVHSLAEVSASATRNGTTTSGITQLQDKDGAAIYPALKAGQVGASELAADAVTEAKIDMDSITGSTFPTATQTVDFPYSIKVTLTRVFNIVIAITPEQVNDSYPQTGDGTGAETIPSGYRPNADVQVSMPSLAGRSGNGGFALKPSGQINYFATFSSTGAFRPSIVAAWLTNDSFPSS